MSEKTAAYHIKFFPKFACANTARVSANNCSGLVIGFLKCHRFEKLFNVLWLTENHQSTIVLRINREFMFFGDLLYPLGRQVVDGLHADPFLVSWNARDELIFFLF